jgi:hypothetical protein
MPSYTRGKTKETIKFVQIVDAVPVYYGFASKDFASIAGVSAGDITALGHILSDAIPADSIQILRATTPKPGTVKKRIATNPSAAQQGSVSTFVAGGSLQTALAAGWRLAKAYKLTSLTQNDRQVTALAVLSDGTFYAFSMNKADFDSYGAELGLESPTTAGITTATEKTSVVRGSAWPYPGKAEKVLNEGSKVSSFYSTDAENTALAAGWQIKSNERILGT